MVKLSTKASENLKKSSSSNKKASKEAIEFPTVKMAMKGRDERGQYDKIIEEMTLSHVQNRDVDKLSGGELQRYIKILFN